MKTATRLLLEAAGHIRRFGLAQSDLGGPGKPCCAVGAIRVAAYGTVDRLTPPNVDPIEFDDREVWRAMMALRTIVRPQGPQPRRLLPPRGRALHARRTRCALPGRGAVVGDRVRVHHHRHLRQPPPGDLAGRCHRGPPLSRARRGARPGRHPRPRRRDP